MVTVFIVTMFFSCEGSIKEVQRINQSSFVPSGEADTINLRYTDSGRIKSILQSPKMLSLVLRGALLMNLIAFAVAMQLEAIKIVQGIVGMTLTYGFIIVILHLL